MARSERCGGGIADHPRSHRLEAVACESYGVIKMEVDAVIRRHDFASIAQRRPHNASSRVQRHMTSAVIRRVRRYVVPDSETFKTMPAYVDAIVVRGEGIPADQHAKRVSSGRRDDVAPSVSEDTLAP